MAVKILELKGTDFMRGLSLQSAHPIGGNLQQATDFDPFFKYGRLYPTKGPTQKDGGSILITLNAFDFYSDGANRFLFGFGNRNASNVAAYKINLDTDAITDISSSVHTNLAGATTQAVSTVRVWQGRIVYDQYGSGQSFRSITPTATGDVNILSSLTSNPHPNVIGPDGYLYALNGQYIAQLVTAASTSGNSATKFDTLESDLIGRDIDHNGQYIVAGFDNNSGKLSGIVANCEVIFWDRYKAYAEKRWVLKEAYIIAVRCQGTAAYVLTPSGWYVCSLSTEPKLVYPMNSETPFNKLPADFNGVSKSSTTIYWADSTGSAQIYAIGNDIAGQPKIVYNPYEGSNTTENMTALICSGSYKYTATDKPRIYKLNSATGITAILKPCPKYLPAPFTFSYTKVILKTPFASGDSVSHQLNNSNDEIISGSETIGYANLPGAKSLLFRKNAGGGQTINDFTDVAPQITTNCEIAAVEVWADPMPNHSIQL